LIDRQDQEFAGICLQLLYKKFDTPMRASRTSPSPTRYTNDRPSTAQDNPQGAPLNPAIADDQNTQENPPATRTDQTEGQGRSVVGDRETGQPGSSVPATATHSTEALSEEPELPPDYFHELDRLLGLNPSDLDDFDNPSAEASDGETFPEDPLSPEILAQFSGASSDSHGGTWGVLAQNQAVVSPYEPQELRVSSIPMGSDRAVTRRLGEGGRASPAAAANPTIALSKALDLGQGFCESPEWQHLAKTQDLALLAKLVTSSLRGTKNPNLKPMLRRLVEEMAAKPKLAERVFVRLQGADESCGDRVSLGLSWAEEEWLAQPVWEGALNHDLPKVIEIARQVFRRRLIEELARQKVEDINKVRLAANQPEHTEDVETLLALLAGLHGPLELGGQKPDAEFTDFRISRVTLEEIESAKWKVLAREGEQGGKRLWEFLATWTPWQEAVLGDLYPDEVAAIKNVLSDPDRPVRLEREATTEIEKANVTIESVPIQFRQGHITRRASQLEQEEALQLWLPLTMKAWSNRED
jgi:hypothetical protein